MPVSSPAAKLYQPSVFQRFVLPGLAFKAVVIGGGYATGREIAEFFLPAGPWGGIAAMLVATAIWCVVCAVTFVFARRLRERDYRSFFRALLGRAWPVFEVAYLLFVVLILAVFGAAAGAIGSATFGAPPIVGTLILMVAIAIGAVVVLGQPETADQLARVQPGQVALFLLVRAIARNREHDQRALH